MKQKAILIGASGAIGNSLLQLLLADEKFAEVLVLVRKDLKLQHARLKQLVINFDKMSDYSSDIKGNVVFCCIGTTKSQTPDQQRYRVIDYQYPLDIAAIALENGAESFHLISSIGADKNSSVFYTRTKGEVENDLKAFPFKTVHIYRPSLLDATRNNKRLMEGGMNLIMRLINPLLIGKLKRYRSIKVESVALAMLRLSLEDMKGIFIHESEEIQQLSQGAKA